MVNHKAVRMDHGAHPDGPARPLPKGVHDLFGLEELAVFASALGNIFVSPLQGDRPENSKGESARLYRLGLIAQ